MADTFTEAGELAVKIDKTANDIGELGKSLVSAPDFDTRVSRIKVLAKSLSRDCDEMLEFVGRLNSS